MMSIEIAGTPEFPTPDAMAEATTAQNDHHGMRLSEIEPLPTAGFLVALAVLAYVARKAINSDGPWLQDK